MRILALLLLCAISLVSSPGVVNARSSWSDIAWGVTVGSPQWVALTLETNQGDPVRFQLSLSTIILYTSFTSRIILMRPSGRIQPYGFIGGGLLYTAVSDWGTASGATGFYWGGGGLRYSFGRAAIFGELGYYAGMATSKGYEASETAYAAGILFEF
jgi:hypothetical protein